MIRELTMPANNWEFTTFPNTMENDQVIVVKDIDFVALCAHHILPFIGRCHIGYIPGERLAGLSKFARVVRWWAKGLWTQEDLTDVIGEHLWTTLEPRALAVVMSAEHSCMTIRGVQAPGTKTVTSNMRGLFLENLEEPTKVAAAREELWQLLKGV